ncbi:MAG: RluA family pseudouridine synthase [Clostridiales bacterium]|nr:RluA family pseudouridine synthase [Clostridiales bacterium]
MAELIRTGDGRRLDVLLSGEGLSRSQAARLIRGGQVRVNGIVVTKPSFLVDSGSEVVATLPEAQEYAAQSEDIPITLLYEDEALAVVIKPAGLVVHPAAGNERGTLVNALLHHLDSLSGIGGQKRPGIVHRLDKDTSGLMLVAKNDRAHLALSQALARRRITKHYLAVVSGRMKGERGRFEGPIARSPRDRKQMAVVPGGRPALTLWRTVRQDERSALVLIRLITGRTHQIRVHFAAAHHPVLGDAIYGHRNLPGAPRLMLHACQLGFDHPISSRPMHFFAPPEASFHAPTEADLLDLMAGFDTEPGPNG